MTKKEANNEAADEKQLYPNYKEPYEFYLRPPEIGKWTSFKLFLYNESTNEVFGRTGESWSKIGFFYMVFYGVLGALFAVCLWVFFQTLDPRIPTWQLDASLIGTSPGLGFRPMPSDANVESTLIWYKSTDKENYRHWVNSLETFLEVYKKPGLTPGRGQNIAKCSYRHPPKKGQVCDVDFKDWSPCTSEMQYNYNLNSPCIFIKLNKIYNWIPEFYNDSTNLPENMPTELKNHIAERQNSAPHTLNTVWVSCEGENPADIENIGPVTYLPQHGFPGYFYPFENSEGYLSPLIAVYFRQPRTGILINIECKAWAGNIKHDRQYRVGMVHFELMID